MSTSISIRFTDELKDLVANRNGNLNHPFARRVINGEATLDEVRFWVGQRYRGITSMGGTALIPILAHAPDDASRKHMWEAIGEENGYFDESSHSGWQIRFGKALGMTEQDFDKVTPLPESRAVRYFYLYKFSCGTFLEAIAALVASESQNPIAFPLWAKSLEHHYKIAPTELAWFTGHVAADSEDGGHAGEGWAIIERLAQTEALRNQVRNSVQEALDIYWLWLDGIQRAATRHTK